MGVGLFASLQSYGIRDCIDGSSNTVAFSELIIGDNVPGSNNGAEQYGGVPWPIGGNSGSGVTQTMPAGSQYLAQYVTACNARRIAKLSEFNDSMSFWAAARMHYGTSFSMLLPPNSPNASCFFYQAADGMIPPRSRHPGGVNTLFGDGSVKFIKDTINTVTWWSIGTKAGGEVVSADSY